VLLVPVPVSAVWPHPMSAPWHGEGGSASGSRAGVRRVAARGCGRLGVAVALRHSQMCVAASVFPPACPPLAPSSMNGGPGIPGGRGLITGDAVAVPCAVLPGVTTVVLVVPPRHSGGASAQRALLRLAVKNALDCAIQQGLSSVAMCCLGAGGAGTCLYAWLAVPCVSPRVARPIARPDAFAPAGCTRHARVVHAGSRAPLRRLYKERVPFCPRWWGGVSCDVRTRVRRGAGGGVCGGVPSGWPVAVAALEVVRAVQEWAMGAPRHLWVMLFAAEYVAPHPPTPPRAGTPPRQLLGVAASLQRAGIAYEGAQTWFGQWWPCGCGQCP
jgi:hypothetical protein